MENDQLYLVRSDHIGRPVFATDLSGVKVWEATYLPFGGVHTSTGANMELRFPGQWYQSESGLHQNWMRDYDPTTGRYIQADPLGLVDGASVYGYARQNPGRYTDFRGEQTLIPAPPRVVPRIGPRITPRIGPRITPRTGPSLGPFDFPPLLMPRDDGSSAADSVDHPYAKEQYRRYKDFCSHPPPPTGNICIDLQKRAEFLFQCAKMRENARGVGQ